MANRARLTEEQLQMFSFYQRFLPYSSTDSGAARVGLQMLEAAMIPIAMGLPVDDSASPFEIDVLCECYRAYRDESVPLTEIVKAFQAFNDRYANFLISLGFREECIRGTPTDNALEIYNS